MALTTTGYAAVDDILAANKVVQMENTILNLFPSAAPLLSMTNRLGKVRHVGNPVYKWLTTEPCARNIALTYAFVAETDTHMHVAAGSGKYFLPGMLFYADNGFQFRTASVDYSESVHGGTHDTVTFDVRSTHNSAADDTDLTVTTDNMAAADKLHLMGNARAEKADVSDGWTDEPTEYTNYIQNFYAAVSIGDMAEDTEMYGGSRRALDHRKRMVEIAAAIETAWYVSKLSKYTDGTAANGQVYTFDGLKEAITTNSFNFATAILTEDLMLSKMNQITEYADINNLAIVGSDQLLNKFATWGADKVICRPEDKTWGFAPNKWRSPYGEVTLIRGRILDKILGGKLFFFVDHSELKKVLFTNGALKMMPNRQNPSQDQKILDIYRGRHGFQWGRQAFHSKGWNWAAA